MRWELPSGLIRPPRLATMRLELTALRDEDVNDRYVGWLNDPEVLRYRGSRRATDLAGLRRYLERATEQGDLVFAIRVLGDPSVHIGNITLNTILEEHRSAELSIMVGSKEHWGRGYAREAIAAVSAYAFGPLGLHRLWAESPNPAFNRAVQLLGWTHEGTKREAFLLDGSYIDIECWGALEVEVRT